MNIPLISGQLAKLHVKLETEDDFELYGGTTKDGFSITPERPESKNEWLVTIDELEVAGKPLTRFDIYVRQLSSGREWVVLSGKLLVSPRSAGVEADKLAPVEYNVTIPVVENAVDLTGAAIVTGIPGPRGWSAYEIAVQNGFVGSEPEWLEHMRQQTATLAVEQVSPLMERAELAAEESEQSANDADEHKKAAQAAQQRAENEATRSKEAADKAEQHENTVRGLIADAAAHEQAAAQSALDALANQQSAEQAAQDAALAQKAAQTAKTDAEAAMAGAQTAEGNAKASANAASADKLAAEQAKTDAQAAQSTAEEQAAIATKAAEDAQAPESIAVQAARPATMVLLKDELMSILGDSSLFNLDTDGQKIIVHTDRLADDQLAAVEDMLGRFVPQFIEVVRYNHHIEVAWRDLNRYADCKNYDEMNAVAQSYGFSSFREDLTSDGWWIYPMNSIYGTSLNIQYFFGNYNPALASKAIRGARIILPENTKYEASASFLAHCTNLEEVYLYAPTMLNNSSAFVNDCPKLTKAEVYVPVIRNLNSWCAGCKSLSHFRFLTPLKNQLLYSQNTWKDCVLDVESVQNIAENLPTMSKLMTTAIGIDAAFQNDDAMLEALALLESKNWNIELQANTSTTSSASSTYSLRGRTIYAKVHEIDGERFLGWGHYVSDPTGYEEFRSVEAAREYFGLPEEALTNN